MDLSRFSSSEGIEATIKNKAEEFIVEEIMKNGEVLELDRRIEKKGEGDFSYFILQKLNWTTARAIKEISKRLNTGRKRFGYAGTKDKVALTTQMCSAYQIEPDKLLEIRIKDIKINGVWKEREKAKLGQLLGNRFRIKINTEEKNTEEKINKIYKELEGKFPNYFGEQRFGSNRKNTHKVGELILRNRLKDAVLNYLCDCDGEKNKETVAARKDLKETLDYKKALNYFPKYLIHERTLLDALSKNPNDHANALRKLPRPIILLFVHAFQSYLFNLNLSERIKEGDIEKEECEYCCKSNSFGFPQIDEKGEDWLAVKIIGYETKLNKREKELLERFMIHKDDFKVKSIPEISSKGTYRTFFSPLKDFKFKDKWFSFSLPVGSYATSALREFIKN